MVNDEVQDLFKQNGWNTQFDKKSGGYLGRSKPNQLLHLTCR